MPIKYSDETYKEVFEKIKERDSLIAEVAKLSKIIADLTKLREQTRTRARRLKSSTIAADLGVSQSWVEKISERRINRT